MSFVHIIRLSIISLQCHLRRTVEWSAPRLDCWNKIINEGEHVKREDESDRPLKDSGRIVDLFKVAGTERDCEDYLDEDKGELDPEGVAEDLVFTEMYS